MIRAKLDANESPFDLPEEIKAEILHRAQGLSFNRYESPYLQELQSLVASRNGIDPDGVIIGNGSDELIQLLIQAFSGPGKPLVIPSPTFSIYRFLGNQVGSRILDIPLVPPDFQLDLEQLLGTLQGLGTDSLLFLCRPNNPTGNSPSREVVAKILEAAPGLVIIDEAYVEFSNSTLVPLLDQYSHLVILRTLSKAYRLAGLRVGYLLAHPHIVARLVEARMPYTVNVFSQLAGLVVLEQGEKLRVPLGQVRAARDDLSQALGRLPGVTPLPSETNFILLQLPVPTAPIQQELRERGILVRHYPEEPALANYLRVSVGSREENQLLVTELERILRERRLGDDSHY